MVKERVPSQSSAKPQGEKEPKNEEQSDNQTAVFQPGCSFDLPRAALSHRVQVFQRTLGNRAVQRLLNLNVIQREGENTTPIPPLPDVEARRNLALTVLKKAYGGMIKQEPNVTEVKGLAAMQAAYDQSMIRQNRYFKEDDGTKRKWGVGDAARREDMNKDFPGFYDPGGSIYLDTEKQPDEQTATMAHEMLHANSNGEILSTFGKQVDEGITEKLTQNAFKKAGYSAPGGYFEAQIEWVGRLSGLFGENTIMIAYFNGVAPLRSMVDTTLDEEGAFDKFAVLVRAGKWDRTKDFFDQWEKVVSGSEVEKKVAAIVNRLDQWWVEDEDITHVENIFSGSSPDEQVRLRQEISPRIGNMSDHGHRARLRILVG